MSVVIDEGVDTDLTHLLDFEYAPPCEAPSGDCDNVAEWKVRVGCCGHLYLICQECMDEILEWYGEASKIPRMHIKCHQCKNIVPIQSFLHSIERI